MHAIIPLMVAIERSEEKIEQVGIVVTPGVPFSINPDLGMHLSEQPLGIIVALYRLDLSEGGSGELRVIKRKDPLSYTPKKIHLPEGPVTIAHELFTDESGKGQCKQVRFPVSYSFRFPATTEHIDSLRYFHRDSVYRANFDYDIPGRDSGVLDWTDESTGEHAPIYLPDRQGVFQYGSFVIDLHQSF